MLTEVKMVIIASEISLIENYGKGPIDSSDPTVFNHAFKPLELW